MNLKQNDKVVKLNTGKWKRFTQIRVKKSLLIFGAVILLAVAVILGIKYHVYHKYQVVSSAENDRAAGRAWHHAGGRSAAAGCAGAV